MCHRILDYNNLHHPAIKEVFYNFVQLERINSETVCEKLIEGERRRSLSHHHQVEGVAFKDGAVVV